MLISKTETFKKKNKILFGKIIVPEGECLRLNRKDTLL